MKRQKNKNSFRAVTDKQRSGKRTWMLVFAAVIAIAAGSWVAFKNYRASQQENNDYSKLVGDWGRPDGDYILRISGFSPDGAIQAAYFNPNPIHVAQANISMQKDAVKLYVELRDVGYPGSKYNLTYDPAKDMLEGTYFQAQMKELYDVEFLRIK
ncbi:MAG: hypothetical protein ABFD91_07400 [Anaerohalosphaeraceae bacterium]